MGRLGGASFIPGVPVGVDGHAVVHGVSQQLLTGLGPGGGERWVTAGTGTESLMFPPPHHPPGHPPGEDQGSLEGDPSAIPREGVPVPSSTYEE